MGLGVWMSSPVYIHTLIHTYQGHPACRLPLSVGRGPRHGTLPVLDIVLPDVVPLPRRGAEVAQGARRCGVVWTKSACS